MEDLAKKIRNIPDFPKRGILFRDITPLLGDSFSFRKSIDLLSEHYKTKKLDLVVSVEARGFILGAPLAYRLGLGFVPIRKPGKLPYKVKRTTYELEYGEEAIEIHQDAIKRGDRVLVFDDLLATGGTARAICELVEELEGRIDEVCFLIELTSLRGREKLEGYNVFSLIKF